MKLRPLIITEIERANILRVREYALQHPVSYQELLLLMKGELAPVGDNPNHACRLPVGYRCVFSIEEQAAGKIRHLSVSVSEAGKYPNEYSIDMIAHEFGFQHRLASRKWVGYVEEEAGAVNVLEFMED